MAKPGQPRRVLPTGSGKPNPGDATLAERWLNAIKNNAIVAALIVVGVCVSGVATVYKALPDQVQEALIRLLPLGEAKASNGWAWAGYLDKDNVQAWAMGPFVTILKRSEAAERRYPLRIGDVVTPTKDIPQVIVDYKTRKSDNVLIAPFRLRNAIQPEADFTGAKFKSGRSYTVADVAVASFPDHDPVVWLRLNAAD